jgi:hypothetical protein
MAVECRRKLDCVLRIPRQLAMAVSSSTVMSLPPHLLTVDSQARARGCPEAVSWHFVKSRVMIVILHAV